LRRFAAEFWHVFLPPNITTLNRQLRSVSLSYSVALQAILIALDCAIFPSQAGHKRAKPTSSFVELPLWLEPVSRAGFVVGAGRGILLNPFSAPNGISKMQCFA